MIALQLEGENRLSALKNFSFLSEIFPSHYLCLYLYCSLRTEVINFIVQELYPVCSS